MQDPGGGVLCRDAWRLGAGLWIYSDERLPLVVGPDFYLSTTDRGLSVYFATSFELKPLDNLQLSVTPIYRNLTGSLRWVDALGLPDGPQNLFAERSSESWDLTLASTLNFTPTLSLQANAQLFVATVTHARLYRASRSADSRVYVTDLQTASGDATAYDLSPASLNLSAVLRYEYLPGSILYLVYTTAMANELQMRSLYRSAVFDGLGASPYDHAVMIKVSYLVD
jgi:hypothetical protein